MLKILLSRTDKIGDVILTLPMAGVLKSMHPNIQIFFLGTTYTEEIVRCSKHIDIFINWDKLKIHSNPINELQKYNIDIVIHVFPNKHFAQLAKKTNIPIRIGTNRRWFHFLYCNYFVNLSRKKSFLHEAQLNLLLLKPLHKIQFFKNYPKNTFLKKIDSIRFDEIQNFYGFKKTRTINITHPAYHLIDKNKFNLILHPKSGGSAHDWDPENFIQLTKLLPRDQINIFFTGTENERKFIQFLNITDIHNLAGLMSLQEFIIFINACDGLVAASTGPLHIAAALNKLAIGLYPSQHTMHPRRWGAIGENAKNFEIKNISPKIIALEIIRAIQK